MRSRLTAPILLLLLAVGCGSSESPSAQRSVPRDGTIENLRKRSGADVGLVQGTGDYAPGRNRVSFLVVDRRGRSIERPRARVWLARSRTARPFQTTYARLEPIGVPGGEHDDHGVRGLYVTHVRIPGPGTYWLLAEPVGGQPIQGLGTLLVKRKAAAPAVGERARPSRTPTLAGTGGDVGRLTTSAHPHLELYRYSVAESLAAGAPFVLVFATPKFCTSRTCGPTVDVVETVRRRFARGGIRFIHVEIYAGNDPDNGVNRWVREWRLPSEPWVFLVGRDGRVAAKFEGSVSVRELAAAVRRLG